MARIPLKNVLDHITVYYAKSVPLKRIYSNDTTHWIPTIEAWAGGSCYTLLTSHFNQDHPIAQINFPFKQRVAFYIHRPGFLNSKTRDILQFKDNSTVKKIIRLDFEIFKMFNHEDRPCSSTTNYRIDDCFDDLIYDLCMEKLNCTHPFLSNKDNICTDQIRLKAAKEIWYNLYKTTDPRCPEPCTFLKSTYTLQEFDHPRKNTIKIKYPNSIKIMESYYVYNGISLVAEIGGYVGLFLGYSVNQITDLAYFVFTSIKFYNQ